jgi:hypothetical protein
MKLIHLIPLLMVAWTVLTVYFLRRNSFVLKYFEWFVCQMKLYFYSEIENGRYPTFWDPEAIIGEQFRMVFSFRNPKHFIVNQELYDKITSTAQSYSLSKSRDN